MIFAAGFVQAAPADLPRTGQTTKYAAGDDGDLQKGVAWPSPRFTDNSNGTVTDNLTGLIWLKNANCTETVGSIAKESGFLTWADALTWSNSLANGSCGLTDGSAAGTWRLPNRKELMSLIDKSMYNPALPAGHPFANVQADDYWSSTYAVYISGAWAVRMADGLVHADYRPNNGYVWPVRSGQ